MNTTLKNRLKGKLIVSCQAYEDNPLYGVETMSKMAESVIKGGAGGIRLCWPDTIRAIRPITDLPIIGINKVIDKDNFDMEHSVFITPTYQSAVEIIEAGCDIVALDGTLRKRSQEPLEEIVKKLKKEYPHILLMADLATLEEGIACEKMGFDILSTTLSGYTYETRDKDMMCPDLALLKALKKHTHCMLNGEGRIWNLQQLNEAWEAGADMVTIGSAITNPMKTTQYLCEHMKQERG